MICQKCGTQIIDGAKFCQKCGAPCGIPKEPQKDVQKPKKKRKKQSNALIIVSSVLIIVLIASAALYFFVLRNHKEKTPYVTGIKMSDDLFDFTFKLDGSVLSIPCKYEDLSNCGWEISDDDYSKDTVLSPGENVGFDMSKNDSTIKFYSYNPTNKEMPIEDCPVGSVEITDDDDIDFSIAKGISIDSTAKEVEDAFGKVERNYEDGSEFTITYKLNNSNDTYTDFHFVDEKNCESITLHNCVVENDADEETILENYYTQNFSAENSEKHLQDFNNDGKDEMLVVEYELSDESILSAYSFYILSENNGTAETVSTYSLNNDLFPDYGVFADLSFDSVNQYIEVYVNEKGYLACNVFNKYVGCCGHYFVFDLSNNTFELQQHLLDPGYTSATGLYYYDGYIDDYKSAELFCDEALQITGKYSSYSEALEKELGIYGFSFVQNQTIYKYVIVQSDTCQQIQSFNSF